ncbi:MAG TPA: phosphatase PAP2 family protein [Candidatus Deferrimicrobiaceae bacterium]|nr:phosphatase PAP2 family protein [Candidatus Deferrimicrobiaceae bacterium]
MVSPGGPFSAYRKYWLPELAALLATAAAVTVLFSFTRLDIEAARWFYHPGEADPWPVAIQPLWHLFYRSAPWVTGSLAVGGAALLLAGIVRGKSRRSRLIGIFLLLCVAIGPGLIVNGILKDHWGRPRPRQIVEFGGSMKYVPPLLPARTHGKSFPCGHCSVGYLYAAGWWAWRRSRPKRGAVSLAVGVTLGTLLGLGRMAAGGHFLSDVAWSGLISLGVAHVLYYYVLRIPAREDSREALYPRIVQNSRWRAAAIAGTAIFCAGIIGGGLLASPHHKDLAARIRPMDFPTAPVTLEVIADKLDVDILLSPERADEIDCTGHVHGFGLPTSRILAVWEFEEHPVPTLRYRVSETGWFTDIDGAARIRLPRRTLRKIIVRVGQGNIAVIEEPGGEAGPDRLPVLDLHTSDGRVQRPPGTFP